MKAVLCSRWGGPSDLTVADLPDPVAGPGEVVVAAKAIALNFLDTLIIAGRYQVKPEFPFSPGAEFAGIVESVGDGVTAFAPGDRVVASIGHGAAREKVVVKAADLFAVPDALDLDRAAGLSITYGTTLYALKDRGEMKPGESLAVLGAAGGTGVAAIEIGKLMGARVIACASSEEKLAFARKLGADDTIDYTREDLKEALRQRTGGIGVDVVYDPVGGPYAEPAVRAMAWGGRFLVIGFAAGDIPKIPLNLLLLKSCDLRGVFWGAAVKRDAKELAGNMRQILDWAAAGKLSAHIHATYPLSETVAALDVLSKRQALGKVILRP